MYRLKEECYKYCSDRSQDLILPQNEWNLPLTMLDEVKTIETSVGFKAKGWSSHPESAYYSFKMEVSNLSIEKYRSADLESLEKEIQELTNKFFNK